jgi:hypothetical protein
LEEFNSRLKPFITQNRNCRLSQNDTEKIHHCVILVIIDSKIDALESTIVAFTYCIIVQSHSSNDVRVCVSKMDHPARSPINCLRTTVAWSALEKSKREGNWKAYTAGIILGNTKSSNVALYKEVLDITAQTATCLLLFTAK